MAQAEPVYLLYLSERKLEFVTEYLSRAAQRVILGGLGIPASGEHDIRHHLLRNIYVNTRSVESLLAEPIVTDRALQLYLSHVNDNRSVWTFRPALEYLVGQHIYGWVGLFGSMPPNYVVGPRRIPPLTNARVDVLRSEVDHEYRVRQMQAHEHQRHLLDRAGLATAPAQQPAPFSTLDQRRIAAQGLAELHERQRARQLPIPHPPQQEPRGTPMPEQPLPQQPLPQDQVVPSADSGGQQRVVAPPHAYVPPQSAARQAEPVASTSGINAAASGPSASTASPPINVSSPVASTSRQPAPPPNTPVRRPSREAAAVASAKTAAQLAAERQQQETDVATLKAATASRQTPRSIHRLDLLAGELRERAEAIAAANRAQQEAAEAAVKAQQRANQQGPANLHMAGGTATIHPSNEALMKAQSPKRAHELALPDSSGLPVKKRARPASLEVGTSKTTAKRESEPPVNAPPRLRVSVCLPRMELRANMADVLAIGPRRPPSPYPTVDPNPQPTVTHDEPAVIRDIMSGRGRGRGGTRTYARGRGRGRGVVEKWITHPYDLRHDKS